jgi:pSer/pThr/pTyr-binding forkhead associated (FHA) protein
MNSRVLGIAGPFQGMALSLSAKNVSIGRDPSNDLWIADHALSRQHCLLLSQDGQFAIRDLGSKNGTLVNGMPVGEQLLHDGDHISIGDSVFIFQLEEGEVHLERSPVELTETTEIELSPLLLRADDSVSLLQRCRGMRCYSHALHREQASLTMPFVWFFDGE